MRSALHFPQSGEKTLCGARRASSRPRKYVADQQLGNDLPEPANSTHSAVEWQGISTTGLAACELL
jgi:hypothetical protein